jgi:RNA polymerase-interacting CarD/CdnL/TRCF family regulator
MSSYHSKLASQNKAKITGVVAELKRGEENALNYRDKSWSASWYDDIEDELTAAVRAEYPAELFKMEVHTVADRGFSQREVFITPIFKPEL